MKWIINDIRISSCTELYYIRMVCKKICILQAFYTWCSSTIARLLLSTSLKLTFLQFGGGWGESGEFEGLEIRSSVTMLNISQPLRTPFPLPIMHMVYSWKLWRSFTKYDFCEKCYKTWQKYRYNLVKTGTYVELLLK